jgi:hypothetical protein
MIYLTAIDIGPCGTIYDGLGLVFFESGQDQIRITDIETLMIMWDDKVPERAAIIFDGSPNHSAGACHKYSQVAPTCVPYCVR